MDKLTKHRKARLLALVEGAPYDGNQQSFATKAKLSKGRISQLLDPDESFGERSAKALALRLNLAERYFEDGFVAHPSPEAAPQEPAGPSPDAAYVARWIDKIQDQEVKERIAHACVALVLREIDGPALQPTPEPDRAARTPAAASRVR